jgi:tripartite-type tricarboxylate transporter receptor subunit TctC
MKKLLPILLATGMVAFGPALHADDYPSRPINLVAVFGPGSASDTICRMVGEPLGEALKTTVVVENRPARTVRSPPCTSRAPCRMATRS